MHLGGAAGREQADAYAVCSRRVYAPRNGLATVGENLDYGFVNEYAELEPLVLLQLERSRLDSLGCILGTRFSRIDFQHLVFGIVGDQGFLLTIRRNTHFDAIL